MDEMPRDGFRHRPLWLLAVAGLVCAQAGFALAAFSPDRTLAPVLDDRPVVSGRHPLHLYHGAIGSDSFRRTGTPTCFDLNFQAGYPKTPVFDGGCRPAELVLLIAGGGYRPAAYKLGLFVVLLLIPPVFLLAGRGIGLPAGASVLAGALGTLLTWSGPVRRMLDEGELDFLTAGLCVIVFVGWLVRYARYFDIDSWVVLALTSIAGWYAHPVVWLGLGPLVIGYYIVYAPRRELAWHLGLLGIIAAGVGPNLWWLMDWGRYWWLPQHSPLDPAALPDWASILGSPSDYLVMLGSMPLGGVLAAGGIAGLAALWRSRCRCGAAVLFGSGLFALAAARVVAAWPHPGSEVWPDRLAPLAAAFLCFPAAFGLHLVLSRTRTAFPLVCATVAALVLTAWCDGPERPLARSAALHTEPLALGLAADQQELVAALQQHTTPAARILWDETTDHRTGWNWTALLPVLTDRHYLGGLDHEAGMTYSFCELRDGRLNGRPLKEWTDGELENYCWWYNVGWVVCRSPAAAERWLKLPGAKALAQLSDGGQPVTLVALDRPHSFVLKGSAKWEVAGPNCITLTDVTPDASGVVWLSLHYQHANLRAYPSYVKIDLVKDAADPMPHISLMTHGPVPRITLMWESP
jgi:hypothetical protein